ncbi:MAG TPA: hypothetical protein VF457_15690 [Burkholderiaceae bacterium]
MSETDGAQAPQPKPRGRKPLPADERLDASVLLRLTAGQKAKLARIGGQEWLRSKIDAARER